MYASQGCRWGGGGRLGGHATSASTMIVDAQGTNSSSSTISSTTSTTTAAAAAVAVTVAGQGQSYGNRWCVQNSSTTQHKAGAPMVRAEQQHLDGSSEGFRVQPANSVEEGTWDPQATSAGECSLQVPRSCSKSDIVGLGCMFVSKPRPLLHLIHLHFCAKYTLLYS